MGREGVIICGRMVKSCIVGGELHVVVGGDAGVGEGTYLQRKGCFRECGSQSARLHHHSNPSLERECGE